MSKANFLPKVRAITPDLRVSPGGECRRELNANMIKLPVNMTACNGAMLTNLIMRGVIKGEEWVAEAFHLGTLALALWRCPPYKDHQPLPHTHTDACKRSLCPIWTKPVPHSASAISRSAPLAARLSGLIPLFFVVFSERNGPHVLQNMLLRHFVPIPTAR